MQDVSHEVSEKNSVLTAVNIQLFVQTHFRYINKLFLALPRWNLSGFFKESFPFDGVVVVRSEQGSIVFKGL